VLSVAERRILGLLASTEILGLRGRGGMGHGFKARALVAAVTERLPQTWSIRSKYLGIRIMPRDLILGAAAGAPIVGLPSFYFNRDGATLGTDYLPVTLAVSIHISANRFGRIRPNMHGGVFSSQISCTQGQPCQRPRSRPSGICRG
jgi:hypothetical protein